MSKTIYLVTPPSPFLLDERVFPSLGILKVGAALRSQGHSVHLLDLSGIRNFEEAVADCAIRPDANMFGITATSPQLPAARRVIETIRRIKPNAKIILGGPAVTLTNAAARKESARGIPSRSVKELGILHSLADVLVAGDGEEAIFTAIRSDSPKLVDADIRTSDLFLTNQKLEELPWPARELLDLETYHYEIDGVPATSLIAQLGCPFKCGFCGGRSSPSLRNIRTRSSENIVAEMVSLYRRYGFRGFMMYDDELNVNPGIIDLMQKIKEAQKVLSVEWRLRGFIKAELFKDEQAAAMHDAGFRWILVGFESGSPRILTNISKMATQEENTRCLKIAHRHGLKVKALMSIGHPGEHAETVEDTGKWLMEVKPDDFDLTIITTYPGTPYYDESIEISPGTWMYTQPKTQDVLYSAHVDFTRVADYYKGVPGEYVSHVWTEHLTPKDLVRMRDQTERNVRQTLNIPFNQSAAARQYEHSMGQAELPGWILRSSAAEIVPVPVT